MYDGIGNRSRACIDHVLISVSHLLVITEVSKSINVQVTGSSVGRQALNGYRWYLNVLRTTFPLFGEVLLICSYVVPNLKWYIAKAFWYYHFI